MFLTNGEGHVDASTAIPGFLCEFQDIDVLVGATIDVHGALRIGTNGFSEASKLGRHDFPRIPLPQDLHEGEERMRSAPVCISFAGGGVIRA